jgi:hypothetical protein
VWVSGVEVRAEADLLIRTHAIGTPCLLAGVDVVGRHVAAHTKFAAGDAGDIFVLDHQAGACHGLALRRIGVLDVPEFFPGVGVEGNDLPIQGVHNDLALSDPCLHTTRGRFPDFKQAFNLVFPKNTPAKEQRLRFPGVIAVTCDTHAHMRAYILSFEHPYFTLTDGDGRFQIDQVPAGSYTLQAWHEGWRILEYDQDGRPQYEEPYLMTVEVRVMAGETSEVEFQLEARE